MRRSCRPAFRAPWPPQAWDRTARCHRTPRRADMRQLPAWREMRWPRGRRKRERVGTCSGVGDPFEQPGGPPRGLFIAQGWELEAHRAHHETLEDFDARNHGTGEDHLGPVADEERRKAVDVEVFKDEIVRLDV